MDNDTNLQNCQFAVDMIGKQTDFDIDLYTRLLTIHKIGELRRSVDLVTDRLMGTKRGECHV